MTHHVPAHRRNAKVPSDGMLHCPKSSEASIRACMRDISRRLTLGWVKGGWNAACGQTHQPFVVEGYDKNP